MTLTRSDITASAEQLKQFSDELQQLSVGAAWAGEASGPPRPRPTSVEPRVRGVPHVWHWRDLRPRALRSGELVGTRQAERRVLQLKNPAIPEGSSTTNTLFAGIQTVMPGEVARAHRHTMAALRFIIESEGGYTNVNGEPIPMRPGDLVLTPNWAWHDHANDSGTPMIWLDGLDAPLVRLLEAVFQEEYPQERQALLKLAEVSQGNPFEGVIMEYTNPVDGGPVMPTIACFVQMLRPGERTVAHRHTATTIYHVVEGKGRSVVGGKTLEWEDKDVFCVPSWTKHEHVNASESEPAFLFSFSDLPVMKALDLYREEEA